jgi:hypothetical protein
MTDEGEIIEIDEKQLRENINPEIEKKPEKKISRSLFEFYYQNLFPYKYFFKWLSNENTGKSIL